MAHSNPRAIHHLLGTPWMSLLLYEKPLFFTEWIVDDWNVQKLVIQVHELDTSFSTVNCATVWVWPIFLHALLKNVTALVPPGPSGQSQVKYFIPLLMVFALPDCPSRLNQNTSSSKPFLSESAACKKHDRVLQSPMKTSVKSWLSVTYLPSCPFFPTQKNLR